ncbi:hypothetical protein H8B13_10940 [Hymenobacter sp. BT188]|uniref:hypothetical protein n=1 Tax=Hymenobacter sp. BT188 TaxID=2763504 RepID=UPI001651077C|nr:hypothetical protein [Hymenobacter sp. BT188]MBC6607335.1 hypothetical protein [Hymenobacter sp. BT188]
MKKHLLIYLSTSLLFLSSCGRLQGYSSLLWRRLTDKVIRHYDANQPDTEFNKKRFQEHFGISASAGASNIYAYSDEMGIDHSYQLSFTSDSALITAIIRHNKMVNKPLDLRPFNIATEQSWWKSSDVETLPMYWRGEQNRWYQILWYDAKNQKAYCLEYDL